MSNPQSPGEPSQKIFQNAITLKGTFFLQLYENVSVDLWIKPFREDASPQCNLRRMVENRGSLIRPLSFRRRRRSDHQLCEPIHRTNRINLLYITRLTFISNIVAFIREKYLGDLPRAPSPASRHPCVYAFTFKLIFSYWANNIRKLDALHKYNRKNLG